MQWLALLVYQSPFAQVEVVCANVALHTKKFVKCQKSTFLDCLACNLISSQTLSNNLFSRLFVLSIPVLPYLVKLHKSGLSVSKNPFEKYRVKKASFFLQNFW